MLFRSIDKEILVLGTVKECFNVGSERIITKLLNDIEAAEFMRWGFEVACGITLLERQLYIDPPSLRKTGDFKIVPFRKRVLEEVLRVDNSAFDDFWRLDVHTIEAIASSCTHNVFLIAKSGGETLGYTIGGVNGHFGYLQRLGVDAQYQGLGIGEALATKALHALHRLGATVVMVNTQDDNLAALQLYRLLGFREIPDPRYIMEYVAGDKDWGR